MLVVGIDPDSEKHGLAIISAGKIVTLQSLDTDALVNRLTTEAMLNKLLIKLEDVNNIPAIYPRPGQSRQQMLKIAQNVGACKQNAKYLLQRLVSAGLAVNLVNPLPKLLSGKLQTHDSFVRLTGWEGRSNADTRDAAMIAFNGKAVAGLHWVYCGAAA